ncbi:electron transfer flavoprotein subunit beta [Marinomonas sp. GJ51-6]|uniref:electron transfer flavoprotein subunit beta n=1 Tax=Marinomonas sp. GJ51-6 TaxID=2992802 RepID=UPI0029341B95|nr:electron transfer flavoprotein subunit beta [Marinomonas sp. GJ51-6]WOD07706.1 electron transfer flavoprotein subunit beta [Marinomonas sp. GJ51-6]
MSHDVKVFSLLSIGRHPQSGRARRAEQDARAVELGLTLVGRDLNLVHAGSAQQDDSVLRQYAGMGLPTLTLLEQEENADILPSLAKFLQNNEAGIVLMGVRAESGESSGMLPYLLAEKLGWPIVSRIADIVDIKEGVADMLLALPRGQRRAVQVALPFIATLDNAASAPRQTAYGSGLRAKIDVVSSESTVDDLVLNWQVSPAKPRPKRMKVVKAKTAADRFKAATAKPAGGGGQVLKEGTPAEKAQAIFDLLLEEKVIR